MKVYVQCYLYKNLGDDLFAKILTDRYKEEFFFFSKIKYKSADNFKIYHSNLLEIINKLSLKVSNNKKSIYKRISKKADINILLGGSIFMEPTDKYDKDKYFNYIKNRFSSNQYIIGTNFGPFQSKDFYKEYYNQFQHVNDICFRDKYSFNLFKELPNVRYAPDIVFSLDTSKVVIKNENSVVMSIINLNNKSELKQYTNDYENKITEMIYFFVKKKYKVILMSFCKSEGDEDSIKKLLESIPSDVKKKIDTYYYDGNINEALNILGSSKIIIGTRFHANIIGMTLGKTVLPIAYSNKTINVLKDIEFKGKILDVRTIKNFELSSLTENDLNYKIDVSKLAKEAKKHFNKLDEILEKR